MGFPAFVRTLFFSRSFDGKSSLEFLTGAIYRRKTDCKNLLFTRIFDRPLLGRARGSRILLCIRHS